MYAMFVASNHFTASSNCTSKSQAPNMATSTLLHTFVYRDVPRQTFFAKINTNIQHNVSKTRSFWKFRNAGSYYVIIAVAFLNPLLAC